MPNFNLDALAWFGKEGIDYLGGQELVTMLHAHVEADDAELDALEDRGALNVLTID